MDKITEKTIKSLKRRLINGWAAENAEEAREIILGIISPAAVIGIGDSSSVRQIGIIGALEARGNRVINPMDPTKEIKDLQTHFDNGFWPMIEATICDIFLTGSNAITEDGRIVNVDGAGNRVAGMVWGHPVTVLVVGFNKIVKDLDSAMDRIKSVIAPEHLTRKGSKAPCTKTGTCSDCLGPNRVCAVTTIIEKRPPHTEMHIVIVNKDLGLGWDRSWPKERIEKIKDNHENFMAMCPLPPVILEKGNNEKLWEMTRQKKAGIVWPSSNRD
ncbi:MAG: lactate utilization protein [Deltaproteobacteria bacterium]|nr:lactate utilization protein [Deltaproteobacteria bacterium]